MEKTIFNAVVNSKEVYGAVWKPNVKAHTVVVFIHGIGEHIERYNSWFAKFCDKGFAVVAADHFGHGRSEGKRGHFMSADEPLNFVDYLVKYAKSEFAGIPIVLYGHSMGGNIVINYTLRTKEHLDASIASSPWIRLAHPPNAVARLFAKLFYRIFPSLTFRTGIKRSQLTVNELELEKYSCDEYVHGKITLSTYIILSKAAKYIVRNIRNLKTPILLLQSKSDVIVDFNGANKIYKSNLDMVKIHLFENFQHELHHETENEIVFNEIVKFLDIIARV